MSVSPTPTNPEPTCQLIQAACAWADANAALLKSDHKEIRRQRVRVAESDLHAAVGVYRTNQTPEGNPT